MDRAGVGSGRAEAERLLSLARKLLEVRDLVGSKRSAERAVEADPLVDGADQILAVSDVLLASNRRINNQFDWYAILQLPSPSPSASGDDAVVAVKREFRRLALLLNPGQNSAPGADAAFRLVADAYSVLSNPQKKALFDAEYRLAASAAAPSSGAAPTDGAAAAAGRFWTACPSCCNVHQYGRQYVDLSLRCPTCSRPFRASELSAEPSIVPGTDMYYCSWGFFPLGFPGGPNFNGQHKPFYPMFPNSDAKKPAAAQGPAGKEKIPEGGSKSAPVPVSATRTKKMARKSVNDPGSAASVRRSLRNRSNGKDAAEDGSSMGPADASGGGNQSVAGQGVRSINLEEDVGGGGGFNMNREFRVPEGSGNRVDEMSFHIDVDATDEILGNLPNLPFPMRFQ